MSETPTPIKAHPDPELYEIRVRGHLDARWANQFEGMTITLEDNGDTRLSGRVADQADGGLEAGDAAEMRGHPDRAAGIGAQRPQAHAGRDGSVREAHPDGVR